MAIGRHDGRIYSVASPDKPEGLAIKGLSCGFIKVTRTCAPGTVVELKDSKRSIQVVDRNRCPSGPDRAQGVEELSLVALSTRSGGFS